MTFHETATCDESTISGWPVASWTRRPARSREPVTRDIEPIAPNEAREMYLEARKEELSEWTHRSHGYRLNAFVEWCDEQGIPLHKSVMGRTDDIEDSFVLV